MAEPQNRRKSGATKNGERTQFKPGQSGNPGGRPKTAKFAELVRNFLDEKNGSSTRLRAVLLDLQKHDPKILLHYAFGKPVESFDVQSTSTIVGLPNDILAQLREYAKSL